MRTFFWRAANAWLISVVLNLGRFSIRLVSILVLIKTQKQMEWFIWEAYAMQSRLKCFFYLQWLFLMQVHKLFHFASLV